MNPIRALAEHLADRVHARADMLHHAQGLTVQRRPWGSRRISHPDLPQVLDRYRLRLMRNGLDSIDRALMDDATAQLFADTARHAGPAHARHPRRTESPAPGRHRQPAQAPGTRRVSP